MRWMASSMARRSFASVCLRASRTLTSFSWLDWSIQSPLFEPGSVGGVRAGAEAIKPSFFFSRISLYFFTSIERMPLYHELAQSGTWKPTSLAPRPKLCKDKVLHAYDVILQEFTILDSREPFLDPLSQFHFQPFCILNAEMLF